MKTSATTQQESTAAGMDAKSLMAQAAAESALDDYGDTNFVEALNQLVRSVLAEASLSPMGIMGFRMSLIERLKNRLRFEDDLKKHPEILDEDVSDPIIITGLARTGTTKLQRIMAADAQTQKQLLWMCLNPAPLTGTLGIKPDPRIALAKATADAFNQAAPDFASAHYWVEEEPDEDCLLLQMTFENPSFGYFYRAPSYMSWLRNHRPLTGAYAYLRKLMQYLQWQDGGRRGRPWVAKSPAHLGMLDEVLAAFPNATVVQCHRNPVVAVPSLCRLVESGVAASGSERIDLPMIGEFFATYSAAIWEAQIEQLRRLKDKANILDIRYDRIRDDAIGVVREIYQSRGMALSSEAERAMRQWEKEHPQYREGKHVYTLERYGLSEKSVTQAFKAYFDYFPAATSV